MLPHGHSFDNEIVLVGMTNDGSKTSSVGSHTLSVSWTRDRQTKCGIDHCNSVTYRLGGSQEGQCRVHGQRSEARAKRDNNGTTQSKRAGRTWLVLQPMHRSRPCMFLIYWQFRVLNLFVYQQRSANVHVHTRGCSSEPPPDNQPRIAMPFSNGRRRQSITPACAGVVRRPT